MKISDSEPVQILEEEATGDWFLIYESDGGLRLDVRCESETLWMTQAQIAQLFGRDQSVISRHIHNIVDEGELDAASNMQKMHSARSAKPITVYTLDMVISVGYRVSSRQGTIFRRWATGVLVQFAKSGFVVDRRRLKEAENAGRIAELREIVRELRADEANVYRELRAICAMCQDYDPAMSTAREFYQRVQAKLIYAVTSHTPSEVVMARSDLEKPNMGLENWSGSLPRKQDVGVSKNYLSDRELKELNRLTVILLDIFEDQLDLGRLVIMDDAGRLLDDQLANLGRVVLRSGGSVRADDAKKHVERLYSRFDESRRQERRQIADESIASLTKEVRSLPKARKK